VVRLVVRSMFAFSSPKLHKVAHIGRAMPTGTLHSWWEYHASAEKHQRMPGLAVKQGG
jgi:hypothetical protein